MQKNKMKSFDFKNLSILALLGIELQYYGQAEFL